MLAFFCVCCRHFKVFLFVCVCVFVCRGQRSTLGFFWNHFLFTFFCVWGCVGRLYVCVIYVYLYMYVQINVPLMVARSQKRMPGVLLYQPVSSPWCMSLTEPTARLEVSKLQSFSCFWPAWHMWPCPAFYMGVGALNSDLHAWAAGALTTVQSL